MEILKLQLVNFRSFAKKNFTFDPKLSVITGPNGSGKSNILEAISLLSGMRSDRVETDLDLIRFRQSEAKVEGRVKSLEINNLTINFQVIDEIYLKKAYFISSFHRRLLDFSDFLSIVIFEPSDLDLVSHSPSLRRHHLDEFLSSIDKEYRRNINAYHKIIVRRNKILERIAEGKAKAGELSFWDNRLVEHGQYISKKREEFFEFLNLPIEDKYFAELSWQLKQSLIDLEKLLKNRERDIVAGMTLSGPQRDDFRFLFEGRDLEYFGSRGEHRMAVLALKIAELEYYTVKKGQRPILGLDDIFSELDWEHREAVLEVCDKQQTIITAAEADSVPKRIFKKAKVVELR